jgi:NAD(P)-dependent dehydrogenase (short-subunit alcohol dehydrogenase family)
MYEQVVNRYGRLDVIYSNMGLMDHRDGSALDTSPDTWRRVHDANLTSVFLCCKHGIKHLLGTEPAGGSVINAASFLAEIGDAGCITAAALPLDGGITAAFTVPE